MHLLHDASVLSVIPLPESSQSHIHADLLRMAASRQERRLEPDPELEKRLQSEQQDRFRVATVKLNDHFKFQFISYAERIHRIDDGLAGWILSSKDAAFVCGAGVAASMTSRQDGTGYIPDLKVIHLELLDLAGKDWRKAPLWAGFLARLALTIITENDVISQKFLCDVYLHLDKGHMLAAAHLIERFKSKEVVRGAMHSIVKDFKLTNCAIANAVHMYKNRALITTTNYDFLLTKAINSSEWSPTTLHHLKDQELNVINAPFNVNAKMLRERSVYHLHGLYTDDIDAENGFTLMPSEYGNIDDSLRLVKLLANAVRGNDHKSAHLVFVGADATLEDEHFQLLWHVLGRLRSGGGAHPSTIEHLVLVRGRHGDVVGKPPDNNKLFVRGRDDDDAVELSDKDKADICEGHPIWKRCRQIFDNHQVLLVPIVYGMEYDRLAEFLTEYAPKGEHNPGHAEK